VGDALTGECPGRTLKIYLLLIDHLQFFFYSDESEAAEDPDDVDESSTPPSGVHGWLVARYKKFRSAWLHANSGTLLWMRRSWDWLHSWAHPDEAMLARLWSARRVDLHHPASRPADQVISIWNVYLSQQWRRHLFWLTCNGIIAPVAIVTLWILPGPNLIGYWFAYRAIHHLLVVWGIRKVQRNQVATELHSIAALDLPIERTDDGKFSHLALTGRAAGLEEHMAWHNSSRGMQIRSTAPPASTSSDLKPAQFQAERSQDG
jgi:hypothetical protein